MKNIQQSSKPYTFNQRIENIFKSYFVNYENIKIEFYSKEINISLIDDRNMDSASLNLKKNDRFHQITFWDGYSQSEVIEVFTEHEAIKNLKRFMKKLVKIINR